MKTSEELKPFISTSNIEFNRFAFRLYLENSKTHTFPGHLQPLALFGFIGQQMLECRYEVLTFAARFEQHLEENPLTLPQKISLYGLVKKYLLTVSGSTSTNYEEFYKDYLGYFTMLEESALTENAEAAMSSADLVGMLTGIVKKQVLRLSDDLDKVTAPQRVKVIASLVKTMPQFSNLSIGYPANPAGRNTSATPRIAPATPIPIPVPSE